MYSTHKINKKLNIDVSTIRFKIEVSFINKFKLIRTLITVKNLFSLIRFEGSIPLIFN